MGLEGDLGYESEDEVDEGKTLAEVRKDINKKRTIILENFSSTGKCKECENGKWAYNFSVQNGERVEEHYMCMHDCGIISSIVFSVKYREKS